MRAVITCGIMQISASNSYITVTFISLPADHSVQEKRYTFSSFIRKCFCFWPLREVVYQCDNVAIS